MAKDDPIKQQFPASPDGPAGSPETEFRCQEWEALAAEAIEGSLSEEQGAAFDRHCRHCPSCAEIWEQSRRGAQWLHFLEERPEPPAGLADAIVAATSGVDRAALRERPVRPAALPLWNRTSPSPRRGIPRSAGNSGFRAPGLGAPGSLMTAAMAFFSLALTVYLLAAPLHHRASLAPTAAAGGPLAGLHLSSLTPSALQRTAVRQYYSLEERSAKFYDNLLVVREVEAEARDLSAPATAQPEPQRLGPSPSSRNGGAAALPRKLDRREVAVQVDWRSRPEDGSGATLVSRLSSLNQRMSAGSREGSPA